MSYHPQDLRLALDLSAQHIRDLAYTSPTVRTVLVLGAAASHSVSAYTHAPRIFITGEYGSGKSTLLTAIQPLYQNPVRNSGQLSTTFAYRNDFRSALVDGQTPVTIIDETKHIFGINGKKGSSHPAYAILTEGYSKTGAPVKYQENGVNVEYSTYQVAVLASRGEQSLPEDVLDRAIKCKLSKKPNGMRLTDIADPDAVANGRQCGEFLRTAVRAAMPALRVTSRDTDWFEQAGLDNRMGDVWIPLFTIADLAGGQWPALVRSAYRELGAKTSRNLPTTYQLRVDVLNYLEVSEETPDRFNARGLIDYLSDLGRQVYTYDDAPFTLKKYGMELKRAGVEAYKANSVVFYRVTEQWVKDAHDIAHPDTVEATDPDNDWEVFAESIPEGE